MALLGKDDHLRVEPPWTLSGRGYILLFRFPEAFAVSKCFTPPSLREGFAGGIGAVILANYTSSPVGPYQELLVIPGRFRLQRKYAYSITKIYVSTKLSASNGRENWGIPKEQAQFEILNKEGAEQITVSQENHMFLRLVFTASRLKVPVTSSLLPAAWRTLAQHHRGTTYVTTPAGRGQVSLARIREAKVDRRYFPDFTACSPLFVIKTEPFTMTFPKPTIT